MVVGLRPVVHLWDLGRATIPALFAIVSDRFLAFTIVNNSTVYVSTDKRTKQLATNEMGIFIAIKCIWCNIHV